MSGVMSSQRGMSPRNSGMPSSGDAKNQSLDAVNDVAIASLSPGLALNVTSYDWPGAAAAAPVTPTGVSNAPTTDESRPPALRFDRSAASSPSSASASR